MGQGDCQQSANSAGKTGTARRQPRQVGGRRLRVLGRRRQVDQERRGRPDQRGRRPVHGEAAPSQCRAKRSGGLRQGGARALPQRGAGREADRGRPGLRPGRRRGGRQPGRQADGRRDQEDRAHRDRRVLPGLRGRPQDGAAGDRREQGGVRDGPGSDRRPRIPGMEGAAARPRRSCVGGFGVVDGAGARHPRQVLTPTPGCGAPDDKAVAELHQEEVRVVRRRRKVARRRRRPARRGEGRLSQAQRRRARAVRNDRRRARRALQRGLPALSTRR